MSRVGFHNERPRVAGFAALVLAFVGPACATDVSEVPSPAASKFQAAASSDGEGRANLAFPEMVVIPGADDFGFQAASKYEITWRQYGEAVRHDDCRPPIGYANPNRYEIEWISERTSESDPRFDSDLPVTGVNLEDMTCYLDWLEEATGREFRLPTVVQWQWLAYGPATTVFPWGNEPGFDRALIYDDGRRLFDTERVGMNDFREAFLLPVGSFEPNVFGLYDVIGNAAEFIDQCKQEKAGLSPNVYPTCRAMGTYRSPLAVTPRIGIRYVLINDGAGDAVGFRIVK